MKKAFTCSICLLIILSISSCSKEEILEEKPAGPKATSTIQIDPTTEYQTIRGFGGINHPVWRPDMNESERKKVFGRGKGELGFSILRLHVDPNPDKWELELPTAQYAHSQGAIIFASPWNAPSYMLDPNNTEERKILPEFYNDYVKHLNNFNTYMEDNGVPLYAISIQNEPDIGEWSQWTESEILDFMKNNAQGIENRVIAPESFQFRRNYSDPLLKDNEALENLDIVGGHIYGGGLGAYPLAAEKGKEVWMTEYLLNQDATSSWSSLPKSVVWGETMTMLSTIHQSMTHDWHAYLWWYIMRYYSFIGDGTQGTTRGAVLKRGFAFSHYSKFVRPGHKRIKALVSGKNLQTTAYKTENEMVVVLINENKFGIDEVDISIGDPAPQSATMYTTSVDDSIVESEVTIEGGKLLFDMPSFSVSTVIISL